MIELLLIFNGPIPDKKKKLTQVFIFALLFGASKGFMKAFEAPQRSVNIKSQVNFYFNTTF